MPENTSRWLKAATLLVTNAIKVGGLLIGLNEALNKPNPRTLDIALAAFMLAGAQLSEETLMNVIQRVFGNTTEEKPRK